MPIARGYNSRDIPDIKPPPAFDASKNVLQQTKKQQTELPPPPREAVKTEPRDDVSSASSSSITNPPSSIGGSKPGVRRSKRLRDVRPVLYNEETIEEGGEEDGNGDEDGGNEVEEEVEDTPPEECVGNNYHTAAAMASLLNPDDNPGIDHELIERVALQTFMSTNPHELDMLATKVGLLKDLGGITENAATAKKISKEPDTELQKIAAGVEGRQATFNHELAKQMIEMEIRRLEHEEKMRKIDVDAAQSAYRHDGYKQQLDKMRNDIDRKILELEKQNAKNEYGLKYTFSLSRDQGASLVISNEPCDIQKRREFDKIWKETAILDHDQETLEGLARKLVTLNVVSNGVIFKRYVENLTSKSRGGAASSTIISKRRYVASLLRNDRVRAFTTGPSFNYGFYDVVDTGRSKVTQATTGQLYGNPRFALYTDSTGLHGADLWDPVMETGEFPVDFPYFSPTEFSTDQGVDSYGRVYSDVVLRRNSASVDGERTRARLKPSSNILITPDLKLGWFEFPPAPASLGATEEKYDRVRDTARDLLRSRKSGMSERFARFARAQLDDDVARFLTALEYVRFTRFEPKNMEWFAKQFSRPLQDKSFETLTDVYAATYGRFDPLTAHETDSLEYLLDSFPKYSSGVRAARAAEEVDQMRVQFGYAQMSPEAIEAAMYLYGTEVLAPWTSAKVTRGILEMVAKIDKPFDYDLLPVLSERLRDVVAKGLDFIGLRMPATPSRTSRDVLLHRRPDFYEAMQRGGVSEVLSPLKTIMRIHNFTDVLKALRRHLAVMGYHDSSDDDGSSSDYDDDDEYSLYNRGIVAPETYAVKQTASRLRERSRVVSGLEDTIVAELRDAQEELMRMVEAGVLPTPSLLLKVNRMKSDLVELASGKRDTVTEQMRILLAKARVPGLKASIDESIRRRELVMDNLESIERASASVERARRDLSRKLIASRFVSPIVTRRPPPTSSGRPPPNPYIPTDKPRMFAPPQSRVTVLDDPADFEMVEDEDQINLDAASQHLSMQQQQRQQQPHPPPQASPPPPAATPQQQQKTPPPVASVAASSPMGCRDVQKVEFMPAATTLIPYTPVSEKWRMRIMKKFFHNTPPSRRVSYAIRVYDVKAVNPNEFRATVAVTGDGNCLYRALAHIILGNEDEYMKIKEVLTSYARNNHDALCMSILLDNDITYISEDAVWGTSDALAIASVMLNTKIYLFTDLHGGFWAGPGQLQYNQHIVNPITKKSWEDDEAIYIEHRSDHFNPVHKGLGTLGEDMLATNLSTGEFLVPTLTYDKYVRMDCDFIRQVLSETVMKSDSNPLRLKPTDGNTITMKKYVNDVEAINVFDRGKFMSARRNLMSDGMSDEKMKFLNNYVATYDQHRRPGDYVEFELVKSDGPIVWSGRHATTINKKAVTLVKNRRIQDQSDMEPAKNVLRVDFANKKVGGGAIFKKGYAQEEMLFLSAPEAIVTMMFMDRPMRDDEAIMIRGVGMFSDYKHSPNSAPQFSGSYPEFRTIDIVAVDAYDYRSKESSQFTVKQIDRDLNKIFAAFNHLAYDVVRSGNLGGGVFKGDIRLKFVLQVIVCAHVGIDLEYCCYEATDYEVVNKVLDACDGKTIAQLYSDITSNWTTTIGLVHLPKKKRA